MENLDKQEWEKPTLEVLNVSMTMLGKSSKSQDGFGGGGNSDGVIDAS